MTAIAFIALGSNLGNRTKNCEDAIAFLKKIPGIHVKKNSKWYETKALTLDEKPQPDYLNGAVQIETELSPMELLKVCKSIEKELGRIPSEKKWEPRVIDLDILLYDDLVFDTPELKIPHPEMHKREFVMKPLSEIAPKWKTWHKVPGSEEPGTL